MIDFLPSKPSESAKSISLPKCLVFLTNAMFIFMQGVWKQGGTGQKQCTFDCSRRGRQSGHTAYMSSICTEHAEPALGIAHRAVPARSGRRHCGLEKASNLDTCFSGLSLSGDVEKRTTCKKGAIPSFFRRAVATRGRQA